MASEQELSDFLKNVEKRAFKRAAWQTRDDEAALDIVQDSMLKLVTYYGDKPAAELPLLFQRILGNQTLDWFRRQKTRDAHFANAHDLLDGAADEDGGPDALEILQSLAASGDALAESAEQAMSRAEVLQQLKNIVFFNRSFLMRINSLRFNQMFAHFNVNHFNHNGECHSKVDIAFRNMEIQTFGNKRKQRDRKSVV